MKEISCHTTRRRLQAPDELSILDARHLERHLAGCAPCARYARDLHTVDRMLVRGLAELAGTVSVRGAVLDQLAQRPARSPRRTFPHLRSAALALPLALVVALLALIVPHNLWQRHDDTTPARATYWTAKRIGAGYPVTVDPAHPNHLLAGAAGQVYESWNAGVRWRRLAPLHGLVIRDLAIDAAHPHHYLVAGKTSVLISTDAGRHWRTAVSGLLGAENMFLLQDPSRPATFFVGPSVLWHSTNGGTTWSRDGTGAIFAPYGIQALTVAPDGTLATAIWGGGVALSHDGGLTWQREGRGLPPHALDVAAGPGSRLWAATDRGIYLEHAGRWRYAGPGLPFFATSVLDRGRYLLAGGNGAVFRSVDGGRTWKVAEDGLPLAPYVFGFVADPSRPNRVYASLDGDGVFRSDDGGRTWQSVSHGLPLAADFTSSPAILFRRHGILWRTTTDGSEPQNLTVDNTVQRAALAPDGGSAAYITLDGSGWALRTVASGGSAARTLSSGQDAPPRNLLWSPDSTTIAAVLPQTVRIASVRGRVWSWPLPAGDRILGWTSDGTALLRWHRQTGRTEIVAWRTGTVRGAEPGRSAVAPVAAPGGRTVAVLEAGKLSVGPWGRVVPVASVPGCRSALWSSDGSRLLLQCGNRVEEVTAQGRGVAHAHLRHAFWVPDSDTDLLVFRHHALWRWSPAHGLQPLVSDAVR